MDFRRLSRVLALALVLALMALPAFAGELQTGQIEGFLERLARTVARLAMAVARLPSEQGAPAAPEDPDEPQPEGDLGSGLDPLG
jgi:Tfp pilus assembly protein FimT